MKNAQVVHKYFSDLGKKSAAARAHKHGSEYMRQLSMKAAAVRKLNASKRLLIVNIAEPSRNCRICGADHNYINDDNRVTYAKAHTKYIERMQK